MTDLDKLEQLAKDISHGPCFPLRITDRFETKRIEDANGNVVIEQPDIWLPEAAEYLVLAGNALPSLIAELRAARRCVEAAAKYCGPEREDWSFVHLCETLDAYDDAVKGTT